MDPFAYGFFTKCAQYNVPVNVAHDLFIKAAGGQPQDPSALMQGADAGAGGPPAGGPPAGGPPAGGPPAGGPPAGGAGDVASQIPPELLMKIIMLLQQQQGQQGGAPGAGAGGPPQA